MGRENVKTSLQKFKQATPAFRKHFCNKKIIIAYHMVSEHSPRMESGGGGFWILVRKLQEILLKLQLQYLPHFCIYTSASLY